MKNCDVMIRRENATKYIYFFYSLVSEQGVSAETEIALCDLMETCFDVVKMTFRHGALK